MTTIEKIAEIRKRHNDDVQRGAVYWADCLQDRQNLLNALEAAVKALEELHERDCHRVANSITKQTLQQIGEMLK